ncbi:ABC transporter ATP-binding protein [Syntrophobacter fumaroxidans]|uniref:Spermidine/putrescine import ATP-binding protein PotA n=1 Tax=Syntrophobacter fumaroxidans (strain DSM 10017 / MPOB) TaxID=335543 RepID=A0LP15_SYNFM|nr:ABC transporter ATP-binding protein [Syntrophobacter fumaroxidans]ABK19167.1 ABC transporter related [Syntrophobacter fumaroxidans MPOB]
MSLPPAAPASDRQGVIVDAGGKPGFHKMNIELRDIVKRFGSLEAVSHVSLDVRDGELFTLLGPSGCGKTTILRLVGGFHNPDAGAVFFNDRDVTGIPPYERNIGMVFQNYALWPHMTIFDNVAYGLKIKKVPKGSIGERVSRALGLVNLEGLEKRYPGQLSGGQQQRVALARALVLNPDVLLLDEPLSNLDAKIRLQVRAEIRKLQKDLAITTVYVTHDQEEALTLSDRIAVIDKGKLQQVGTPWDLYERPANAFVADFIGINNLIPGQVREAAGAGEEITVGTEVGIFLCRSDVRLETGDPCVICVRPETASIGETESAPEDVNSMSGAVSFASFIGNAVRYDVEIGSGAIFRVDVQNPRNHKPYAIGEKVRVFFSTKTTLAIPA